MARTKFTARMEKLFALLRRIESENMKLTERELAELAQKEANYKEIKTYRSKYLDGTLIFRLLPTIRSYCACAVHSRCRPNDLRNYSLKQRREQRSFNTRPKRSGAKPCASSRRWA